MNEVPELDERQPRNLQAPNALEGLLVVDFTRVVAGPICTRTLGDYGAEIIKIENPDGGDDTRVWEQAIVKGESAAFLSLNRNKKSIALDLTTPCGRLTALELMKKADVVVENFSGGIMEKFGLDYATVVQHNPRVIYCCISAYGRKGIYATRPGFDPITQAESGFMSLNGAADGPPMRTQAPIVDIAAGMVACNAILLALTARDRIGRGQRVDVALIDVAMELTGFYGMAYLLTGTNFERTGNSPNGTPTVGLYEASDGSFYMAISNDRLYRRLVVDGLDRPDLLERFATRKMRLTNKVELRAILDDIFLGATVDEWIAKLKRANIPVGYVRSIAQAFSAPEALERGRFSRIAHPQIGWIPNIEPPIEMDLTPPVNPVAPPSLGAHTERVLRDVLGYADSHIDALRFQGAFGHATNAEGLT